MGEQKCFKCLSLLDMRLIKLRVQMFVAPRYATHKTSSTNVKDFAPMGGVLFLKGTPFTNMDNGHFYFISNQYFIDFPDSNLMRNKEKIGNQLHGRPCFYALKDERTGLFWLIPFSSQVSKFKSIYAKKISRYKKCDTIVFGEVLGYEKAFLIQNMCPVSAKYIESEYTNQNVPVRVDSLFEQELIIKAKRVLALQRKGVQLIFPDVLSIEKTLIESRDV